MVKTWLELGVDIFVIAWRSWCEREKNREPLFRMAVDRY